MNSKKKSEMRPKLTIVARIEANANQVELVKTEKKLI